MFKDLLFKPEEKNKKTKLIHLFIVLIYFLLHLIVVLNHEHWMDEAQAWVMSKNLSVPELFQVLCSDGHPCLWFLFLMIFSKSGLSYYQISFISLTIMSIASYFFLEFSPFSLFVKIGIHFSSVFLFYNPVVCRTYSLAALLVVLIGCYYKKRYEHPVAYGLLAGLLFQSHVLLFGMAIGLMLESIIDCFNKERKMLSTALIMLFSMVAAIVELTPNASHKPGVDTSVISILKSISFEKIINGLYRYAYTSWGWIDRKTVLIPYTLLLVLIVLIFVCITKNKSWKENYKLILISFCSLGVFFGVITLVYTPHAQMSSILPMMLLFIMWQLYETNSESLKMKNVIVCFLAVISFLTFIPAQSSFRMDLFSRYSYSKDAAEKILEHVENDGIILMENQTYDSSVYSYISSKKPDVYFYDLYNDKQYVFCEFGIDYKDIDFKDITESIKNNDFAYNKTILLLNKKIDNESLELIYTNENEENLWNEIYYIYTIKNDLS